MGKRVDGASLIFLETEVTAAFAQRSTTLNTPKPTFYSPPITQTALQSIR